MWRAAFTPIMEKVGCVKFSKMIIYVWDYYIFKGGRPKSWYNQAFENHASFPAIAGIPAFAYFFPKKSGAPSFVRPGKKIAF